MGTSRLFALSFLAACVPAVAVEPPVPAQAPPEPEPGYLGFQPPEIGDIRLDDTLLHQDTTGGVNQTLHAVAGAPRGGFALIWRDQRDAMLSFYWARLDAEGALREPERTVSNQPGTQRRFDPAITIAPDGAGAVGWASRTEGIQRIWFRCFDAQGKFYGDDLVAEGPTKAPPPPTGGRLPPPRGAAPAGGRAPTLLARADGSRALVWIEGGRIQLAEYDVAGSPLRPRTEIGPPNTEPEGPLHAIEDADGAVVVAWSGKDGAWLARRPQGNGKGQQVELGAGTVRGIATVADAGCTVLLQRDGAYVLRRVGRDGKAEPEVVRPAPGLAEAALASTDGALGVMLLLGAPADGPGGGRGGGRAGGARDEGARGRGAPPVAGARVELQLLERDLTPRGAPLRITTDAARDVGDARVAGNGARFLVAWSDGRLGDQDVWARLVDPARPEADRLGPERRVNTDVASADQLKPDVDAVGERGLAVWLDRRSGEGQIYGRRFGAAGPEGNEFTLPVGAPPARGAFDPMVVFRPDGTALVAWMRRVGERNSVEAQVLAPDGSARGPAVEVDAREGTTLERVSVAPLSGSRGFLLLWGVGQSDGIHARRITPDGALGGSARRISDGDDPVRHGDLALLDDGRLIAGWTVHKKGAPADKGWSVRARFLDADGGPKGGEMTFEPSRWNEDFDPVFAPARSGGFLMAWTSGTPSLLLRDVNVRLFDAQGRPAGPILTPCVLGNEQDFPDVARLTDGSHIVVWEDDISLWDQGYCRRILPDGRSMGPMLRIAKLDTLFVPDRVEPRVTAFGDGWAAVFADRQRSRGFDARVKIAGPRFDAQGAR